MAAAMERAEGKEAAVNNASTNKVKDPNLLHQMPFFYAIWIFVLSCWRDLQWWWSWGDGVKYNGASGGRLRKLMEFSDDYFKANGIEYWLDWGCLLGAQRHGRLVLWDYDLDVAMAPENYDKIRKLAKNGDQGIVIAPGYKLFIWEDYKYARIATDSHNGTTTGYDDNELWIDIVEVVPDYKLQVYRPNLHEKYLDPSDPAEYDTPLPMAFMFPLKTLPLWDRQYPVPNRYDDYLRVQYGNYWIIRGIPLTMHLVLHPITTSVFLLQYLVRLTRYIVEHWNTVAYLKAWIRFWTGCWLPPYCGCAFRCPLDSWTVADNDIPLLEDHPDLKKKTT